MKAYFKTLTLKHKILIAIAAIIFVAGITLLAMAGGGILSPEKNSDATATKSFSVNIYTQTSSGSYENSGTGGYATAVYYYDDGHVVRQTSYSWQSTGTMSLTYETNQSFRITAYPRTGYKLNSSRSNLPYSVSLGSSVSTTTFYAYFDLQTWQDNRSSFSGSGTSTSPYIIATPQQLAQLAYNVNNGTTYSGKYFKQTADINLGGYEWIPIGDSSHSFQGEYDGQNYQIKGMYVNGTDHCALFGNIVNTSIKNVKMVNAYVRATGNFAGAIVGDSSNSNISHCQSLNGYIYSSGSGSYTGGLAGYIGSMDICFASGLVHGYKGVGGLSGDGGGGCTECINECTVEGIENVGGISGSRNASVASLAKCINRGTVIGLEGHSSGFGGIVGATNGELINCVVDCQIRLRESISSAGALAGASDNNVTRCSAKVDCNVTISPYQATPGGWSYKNPTSCYSQVNSTKTYSAGDFSGYSIVENMNGGLPIQTELFWPAVSSSQTINSSFWSSKGFSYRAI